VTDTPKHGVFQHQGLDAEDLAQVRKLARLCEERDRIDLRLSVDVLAAGAADPPHSFLSYRDGALVGFLTMYGLGDDEAEASGATHPDARRQGVFRTLVHVAREACRKAGTPALILYADDRSQAARAVAAALGAERTFSEAKLRLADAGAVPEPRGNFAFRQATEDDAAAIALLLASDMAEGTDPQQLKQVIARNMRNPNYRYYVGELAGDAVGTLNVQELGGDLYIYGFVVRPEYRGQGYGRDILTHTLRGLANQRPQPVYLEVEPDNTPALNLYRSLGIETLAMYDSYRMEV
jgi:ribosomal protein S18 acetylase RimI-like enzyme